MPALKNNPNENQAPAENASAITLELKALQEELKKTEKAEKKTELRSQILGLKRELNRAKQYTVIASSKLAEWKNSLDAISAADLMRLDKESGLRRWELLSKSFLYKRTTDKDGNIFEEPVDSGNIKEGDTLMVDFWKNGSANRRIWAGHMLPSSINIVKITSIANGKPFEQYWVRWTFNNLTGYYSPDGRYLPVFTGDTISIPKQDELNKIDWLKDVKIFENSTDILQKRNTLEESSLEKFVGEIDNLERVERWFWISTLLIREAGKNDRYQDTLNKAIQLGEQYIQNWHDKYSKEDIESAINRLKKTRELLGERNLWLNIETYKAAIAKFESGAKWYFARNDGEASKLWVNPDKYAYWKYQFIPMTLRWYSTILESYWITISKPMTESEIQSWLNNADAQEAVMDQYIIDMVTSKILTDNKFSQEIVSDPSKIAFYLALTHIGWPWALYNQDRADYFNTPVSRYANMTWERYKENIA